MKAFKNVLRITAICAGALFFLLFALAFTDLPFTAYHKLAAIDHKVAGDPATIVIMGGNGMPSPSGLMRCYYGAELAKIYPESSVLIALPGERNEHFSHLRKMAHEMVIRGVDSNRIVFASKGYNTRTQAIEVFELINDKSAALLIVTSPEHMYRTIKSFQKIGFMNVGGNPAFERPNSEESLISTMDSPLEIDNLTLRYNLWNYLQYEIVVIREYVAITYYWLRGWL